MAQYLVLNLISLFIIIIIASHVESNFTFQFFISLIIYFINIIYNNFLVYISIYFNQYHLSITEYLNLFNHLNFSIKTIVQFNNLINHLNFIHIDHVFKYYYKFKSFNQYFYYYFNQIMIFYQIIMIFINHYFINRCYLKYIFNFSILLLLFIFFNFKFTVF